MMRTFAAHGDLIHDPASGMTHRAPTPIGSGRVTLAQATVTGWPSVAPGDLGRSTPDSICWSPIVRCNLHCPQCLDDTSVKEADTTERHRVAHVLADADVLGVDISGGEPLLLRDLPRLLDIIRGGRRSAVSITTNGWHLARRAAELVGHTDAIRVSLDGPDVARHDAIRGPLSFARAIEGIQTAVALRIPVQIQTVLMRRTAGYLQEMVDLAAGLGACGFSALQMLPIGAGTALPDELLSDDEALTLFTALDVPERLNMRLRTRDVAGNFAVIRADGRVWRNDSTALNIGGLHPLRSATDLALSAREGTP
ncbi:Putative Fe-S oxidoreductas [Micromonospora lupini str. Lupac 08]|uniref:Putative Fe-S oxidoreductas n=2 Tax=Micromonospora lupini TaxID=285679 RepID=I0L1U3_9ACTN|nr:Putative Fe-S oxidoreductas [Micromonospora lupini str. Lupac 08]